MPLRWIALLLVLVPFALPAQVPYKSTELSLTFPAELGGMRLVKVTDYEQQSPGLGTGLSYRSPNEKADLYIYRGGPGPAPAGIDSAEFLKHFDQVIGDVLEMEKSGHYSKVTITVPRENITIGQQPFLHAEIHFTHQNEARVSHIYLTVLRQQYFKIRYTYLVSESAEGQKVLSELLKSLDLVFKF